MDRLGDRRNFETMNEIVLSLLGHTWILDLDGTIVKHNGYKIDGMDTFLEGAEDFLRSIPKADMIIFLTSRTEAWKEKTIDFLLEHNIKYDYIIFNVPYGERILINDDKPGGLGTGITIRGRRDGNFLPKIKIDASL